MLFLQQHIYNTGKVTDCHRFSPTFTKFECTGTYCVQIDAWRRQHF